MNNKMYLLINKGITVIDLINTAAIMLASLAIFIVLYITARKNNAFSRVVYVLVYMITAQIVVDTLCWYTDEVGAPLRLQMLLSTMEYTVCYLCYIIYGHCVLKLSDSYYEDKTRDRKILIVMNTIGTIALLLLLVIISSGKMFYYQNGLFTFGKYSWWALVYPIFQLVICTILLLVRNDGKWKERHLTMLFGWLTTIGVVMKFVFNESFVARITNLIVILFLYINVIVVSQQEAAEQKAALERAKMDTMVSQIRPHFIFNSLSSIIDLCPEKSECQEALIQFAKYLRVNIDALSYNYPRLFKEEMQHVKAYVTLEKYNYGERLQVEYDIQAEHFTLPVLSLQPLVENAIKYSFVKNKTAHIVVRTEESDDAYIMTVEDNGGGFDVNAQRSTDRQHTGIDNVRYRLKEMVDGTLTYENIDNGTRAIMTIPKDDGDNLRKTVK